MTSDASSDTHLSIGAISKTTGIPAATLRTWERRYGFPDPERNEAGHREYSPRVVDQLKLISEALERGYRASNVVGLSKRELEKLLDTDAKRNANPGSPAATQPQTDATDTPAAATPGDTSDAKGDQSDHGNEPDWLSQWMSAVDELDGQLLDLQFRNAWNKLGGLTFLEKRAGPFLENLGRRWQIGELDVAHEHYTSQCLQDFLSSHWRPLSDRNNGPRVICATFSGEQHGLGLHFAAVVLAMAGWQIVFLGPSTPQRDIIQAAEIKDVSAVLVSISSAFNPAMGNRELESLRDSLPDEIKLIVGGGGAPEDNERDLEGVYGFASLEQLHDWALEWVSDGM